MIRDILFIVLIVLCMGIVVVGVYDTIKWIQRKRK